MSLYIKWIDRLNKVLMSVMGILMIIMILSITYQVLVRNLFPKLGMQISAPWAGELPLYCMIWLIFLGAAVAMRNNKLISVDILQTSLSSKWETVVSLISIILSVVFYVGILIAGYYWALFGMSESSTSMPISMFFVYVSLPVSAVIMIANAIAYIMSQYIIGIPQNKLTELTQGTEF